MVRTGKNNLCFPTRSSSGGGSCLGADGATPGVRECWTVSPGAAGSIQLLKGRAQERESRKQSSRLLDSVASVVWIFLELHFSFLCVVCPSDLTLKESEFLSQHY